MEINNKYALNSYVYLKTDIDQRKRFVASIRIVSSGGLIYELVYAANSSEHYEREITLDKNVNIQLDIE